MLHGHSQGHLRSYPADCQTTPLRWPPLGQGNGRSADKLKCWKAGPAPSSHGCSSAQSWKVFRKDGCIWLIDSLSVKKLLGLARKRHDRDDRCSLEFLDDGRGARARKIPSSSVTPRVASFSFHRPRLLQMLPYARPTNDACYR